jgi:hypothetical protein
MSYTMRALDTACCNACGALVDTGDQDRHNKWHWLIARAVLGASGIDLPDDRPPAEHLTGDDNT